MENETRKTDAAPDAAAEEDDLTVVVRPGTTPVTNNAAEEDEDATVAVRLQAMLKDERLATPRGDLPEPPEAKFTRPDTEAARGSQKSFASEAGGSLRSMGSGPMIGISLVASIVAGTLLGWLIDKLTGNTGTPWGLIVGFTLGVIAGFGSVVRLSNELNRESNDRSGR
ncbi:MAG: hypothetical protein OHK0029_16630 [Armatimonadaceae bacterium]